MSPPRGDPRAEGVVAPLSGGFPVKSMKVIVKTLKAGQAIHNNVRKSDN